MILFRTLHRKASLDERQCTCRHRFRRSAGCLSILRFFFVLSNFFT